MGVRLHISLDERLVRELDRWVGPRGRSSFIAEATREALERRRRWELIESSIGEIEDHGHEWDADPASWVRDQRRTDADRVG